MPQRRRASEMKTTAGEIVEEHTAFTLSQSFWRIYPEVTEKAKNSIDFSR